MANRARQWRGWSNTPVRFENGRTLERPRPVRRAHSVPMMRNTTGARKHCSRRSCPARCFSVAATTAEGSGWHERLSYGSPGNGGSTVVQELVKSGAQVRAFVRKRAEAGKLPEGDTGDMLLPPLRRVPGGCHSDWQSRQFGPATNAETSSVETRLSHSSDTAQLACGWSEPVKNDGRRWPVCTACTRRSCRLVARRRPGRTCLGGLGRAPVQVHHALIEIGAVASGTASGGW
jgi:hypothetical protein